MLEYAQHFGDCSGDPRLDGLSKQKQNKKTNIPKYSKEAIIFLFPWYCTKLSPWVCPALVSSLADISEYQAIVIKSMQRQ